MRPLRKGEYDLANISLIGHDPVTGRSYEACKAEWDAELAKLQSRSDACRWWQFIERFRIRRQAVILAQRLGF